MLALKHKEFEWEEELQFPSTRRLTESPHVIGGRYPCRSVAYVPRMIISSALETGRAKTVLDPFMGSGTTAIEASKYFNKVYGLEIDPYARLIASVSARRYSKSEINELKSVAEIILNKASTCKANQKFNPQLKNIRYWFDDDQFENLLKIKTSILTNCRKDHETDFFLAAFGDIIRQCSKAERQSLKPYISTKYIKVTKPPLPTFEKAVSKYIAGISNSSANPCAGISWLEGDATNFKTKTKIDLAITSPPYINAMDYTRCIKLESAWIGTGSDEILSEVRAGQLGETVRRKTVTVTDKVRNICNVALNEIHSVDGIRFQTAMSYFQDIYDNLSSVYSALNDGGQYHMIIGNSTIRGIHVETHRLTAELAESVGFRWDGYFKYRIKDHRTSIPRNGNGGKIEFEHVITLTK